VAVVLAAGCAPDATPAMQLDIAVPLAVGSAQPALCLPGTDHLPVGTAVTEVRLTVLTSQVGGTKPQFVCDRVVSVGNRNVVELLVPSQVPAGSSPFLDITLDAYAPADGGGVTLKYTGQVRHVPVGAKVAQLLLTPPGQFSCLPAQLGEARAFHSVTALPNGTFLLAGGLGAPGTDPTRFPALGSLEIFDPQSYTITTVNGALTQKRAFHDAVLLGDPNGAPPYQVLFLGGVTAANDSPVVESIAAPGPPFLLSPIPGTTVGAAAEVVSINPSGPSAMPATAPMGLAGKMFGTSAASAGSVLFGSGATSYDMASAFHYDGTAQSILALTGMPAAQPGTMAVNRVGSVSAPLGTGQALVFGGNLASAAAMTAAESAEVVSGLSTPPIVSALAQLTAGSDTPTSTAFASASTVAGSVYVIGGFAVTPPSATSPGGMLLVQRFTPQPGGMFAFKQYSMSAFGATGYLASTDLNPDVDAILLSGGNPAMRSSDCGVHCSSSEAILIDQVSQAAPTAATLSARHTGSLQVERYGHRQTHLFDGTVLVTGGIRYAPDHDLAARVLDASELYNPFDSSYDRVNVLFSVNRMPAQEADPSHRSKQFPVCPTSQEYHSSH
jgi:hypothetical protein